jgi:hypothetical protein
MVLAFPRSLRYFNSNSTISLGIFCQHQRDCLPDLSWYISMAQLNLNYNPGFLPPTSRRLFLLPLDPSSVIDMESNQPAQEQTSDFGSSSAETPPPSLLSPTREIESPKAETFPTPPLTSHPKSSYISFADMPVTSAIFRVFPPRSQETTALLPAPVSYQPRFRRKFASMHALSRTHELVAGLFFVVVFFALFMYIVVSSVEVEDIGRGVVTGSETTVYIGLQRHWTWELMGRE